MEVRWCEAVHDEGPSSQCTRAGLCVGTLVEDAESGEVVAVSDLVEEDLLVHHDEADVAGALGHVQRRLLGHQVVEERLQGGQALENGLADVTLHTALGLALPADALRGSEPAERREGGERGFGCGGSAETLQRVDGTDFLNMVVCCRQRPAALQPDGARCLTRRARNDGVGVKTTCIASFASAIRGADAAGCRLSLAAVRQYKSDLLCVVCPSRHCPRCD